MSLCPNCSQEVPDNELRCEHCGTALNQNTEKRSLRDSIPVLVREGVGAFSLMAGLGLMVRAIEHGVFILLGVGLIILCIGWYFLFGKPWPIRIQ